MKVYSIFVVISLMVIGASSCEKYDEYDNLEVIENTYSGNVIIESGGADPGGDFTGNGDSGVYSFVWNNPTSRAELNFDITTPTGSVQFILRDAKGKEVLNKTRSAGGNDTFSGVSEKGDQGMWLVEITLTDFNGDGSFSLSPVD
ncbi:MAG: hypothetical protein ABFS32_20315 [Bacteroidota bacterium]